ncbi:glycosyltransferase [Streptomyces sp. NPDC056730]|uniref:glycosyltransferase n=1 Tax=unclassified Streptomyces TaxID=2593676 RepID=UPI0036B4DE04
MGPAGAGPRPCDSRLAGPLTRPNPAKPYRVQYRSLLSQEPHRIRAALLLGAAPLLSLGLFVWLMQPQHWTERDPNVKNDLLLVLDIVMLVSIGLIELFRTMNVLSNAHATLVARDPVPVVPEANTRVAFLTSFVPGKEPLEMVTKTLEAALRIRHRGPMHVWLLDEGDDPAVKEVCARLGVYHFSRKGGAKWNQAMGAHRAKTKHGNYNAWLDAHGDDYEFFASVDTDHVPMPNYLERMLGYFRDPDVGFVIGPQVYGNYDTFVTKAAESQQFLFHALIQRAGNRYGAPMLVGTSNAVRIRALKQIGGLYDSITEDMATGFEMHRARNPRTSDKSRLVDLKDPDTRFTDGPTLEKGTRYPSASLLPDDSVLVTGGSEDYRGARRLRRAPGPDVRPGLVHVQAGGRPGGGPQLPLGLGAAARRPRHDLRLGHALRRQGQHQAGRLRAADRDLHPAVPLPRRTPHALGRPEECRARQHGRLQDEGPCVGQDGEADATERGHPCHRRRTAVG